MIPQQQQDDWYTKEIVFNIKQPQSPRSSAEINSCHQQTLLKQIRGSLLYEAAPLPPAKPYRDFFVPCLWNKGDPVEHRYKTRIRRFGFDEGCQLQPHWNTGQALRDSGWYAVLVFRRLQSGRVHRFRSLRQKQGEILPSCQPPPPTWQYLVPELVPEHVE